MKESLLIKNAKWFGRSPDEWLRHIINIHFDPDYGSDIGWTGNVNWRLTPENGLQSRSFGERSLQL